MSNKSDELGEKLLEIFCSMKLGLVLLGIIALVSGIGTLIPQQSMDPNGAQAVAEIWRNLGFTSVYSSPWFHLLLGLLCINLLVCSVQRFKRFYKLTFAPEPPKESSNIPKKINAVISGSDGEALRQKTQESLKKKGFRITQLEKEGKWNFIAQKHGMGNWGPFTIHIAFVILVLGALTGSLSGFSGYIMADAGREVSIRDISIEKGQVKENFMLKINSVEDRILPNGERDNWYTNLSIIESGEEVQRDTISVNHPLTYKGMTFYQTSYVPGAEFTVDMMGKKFPVTLQSRGGNYFNAPGTNLYLVLAEIKGDPQKPVIFYQVFDESSQVKMGQLTPGQSENIQDTYTVTFDKTIGFTGLQVKSDPGVGVVWLGCGLLMIGLILAFYWRPVRISGSLDLTEPILTLGAYSGKYNMGIKKEFDKVVDELKA